MSPGYKTESSTTEEKTAVFQMHLTPVDETMPYRFVGSYEYGHCIKRFTKLAAISTAEEIKVYDEILKDHPEFTYYQGVSTAFQSPPDLTKADPEERSKFDDRFQKGGMAWMLALARVEYGATLSMYSNSDAPFRDVVGDSTFGIKELVAVLIDDSAAHIKALEKEKLFLEILDHKRNLDNWTVAYTRRLKVIKDMMLAVSTQASEEQLVEMRPYFVDIAKIEKTLVGAVQAALQPYLMGTTSETTTRSREYKGGKLILAANPTFGESLAQQCQNMINRINNGRSKKYFVPPNNGAQKMKRGTDSRYK